jgi:dUTP pyrophosphatase
LSNLNVKVKKVDDRAIIPSYQTIGSAGFDIASIENITIDPLETVLVRTGLSFEIPQGYELQLRPRSGLALKYNITFLNSPATIDSDFRGEVKVIITNLGKHDFNISYGDRIAQGIISKIYTANFELSENLSDTDRGSKGFGSTGIKN